MSVKHILLDCSDVIPLRKYCYSADIIEFVFNKDSTPSVWLKKMHIKHLFGHRNGLLPEIITCSQTVAQNNNLKYSKIYIKKIVYEIY